MKKILTLLTLAALLLVGCADMGDPSRTLATEAPTVTTTATVTILNRDAIATPEQFTDDEIEIITAMWNKYKQYAGEDSTINGIAENLNQCGLIQCGDGYVLNVIDYKAFADALHSEIIGGYEFRHTCIIELDYYHNGEFYLLKDAYANGLITDDELRSAWEEFKTKYPSRYENDVW